MRLSPRILLLFVGGVLFALACNLTTTPPTPTLNPVTPTLAPTVVVPTLYPSITPLFGFGGAPTSTSACPPPAGWLQYIVVANDTLAALAQATGTSVQIIVSANCLPDANTLYSGEPIYLPRSPVSG